MARRFQVRQLPLFLIVTGFFWYLAILSFIHLQPTVNLQQHLSDMATTTGQVTHIDPTQTAWVDLKHELQMEQQKGVLQEEANQNLHNDKIYLQQEVARMEEIILLLLKEKSAQAFSPDASTREAERCLLPLVDGFPECQRKMLWMEDQWMSDPCYSSFGVNGSSYSFYIYLSEVEHWCPVLPGRNGSKEAATQAPDDGGPLEVRASLEGLYSLLSEHEQVQWVLQRIQTMEDLWVQAGTYLAAKQVLTNRRPKQILLHMGLVTASGFNMGASAFSGGPLGELVQWSDLISSLYILGHQLHLSTSHQDLERILGVPGNCPALPGPQLDLVYIDIVGLDQLKAVLGPSWVKYRCLVRVLDSFGTEPEFNHKVYSMLKGHINPWGRLHLNPPQFYTMFPHTPDNSFLGFVVEQHLSTNESQHLSSIRRHNQALIYGKKAGFWKDKGKYLDVINNHTEIHATVYEESSPFIPSYVHNHGFVNGEEIQVLLRQSKVFVGLSFPYEGPAPLEAIANGCAFLNPRFHPPQSSRNTDFFRNKPTYREVTSQHPYAEQIGEPYVWTIDMNNTSEVERALTAILNQEIQPYLPYEFTCEGMLQRVSTFIEKQDFCHRPVKWPPHGALQAVLAEVGTSCKQACQAEGLICEPTFFQHLNSTKDLAKYGVECETTEYSNMTLAPPAFSADRKYCLFQTDELLFSCAGAHESLSRVCPCRDFIKDQIALCRDCL